MNGWKIDGIEKKQIENETDASFERKKIIKIVNNRIYFYADITRVNILHLVESVKNLEQILIAEQINYSLDKPAPIFIHLNSHGGCFFAGMAAMDNLQQCKCELITIVDGMCASAATFLSIIGNKRYMTSHSVMLIHQISSAFWGKYEEFEDRKKNLDMLMKNMRLIYKQYTKIPVRKLNELLKRDLYFDAQQCLEYGLIDEILK